MVPEEVRFGNVRIQLLHHGDFFDGLGAMWIGKTQVRGNALPLRPVGETVKGLRFDSMRFRGVEQNDGGAVIHAQWLATDAAWETRLDHSLDRILTTGSWSGEVRAVADVRLILRPSRVEIDGRTFDGFSYAFEVSADPLAIHLLIDRSTWEIGGRISGCTYFGQINFQNPTAHYTLDSAHTSEGLIDFPMNPYMTQAMPRWAGGPTVDYLFRDNHSLVLFYDKVALIRSVMKKSPGEDHLKFFEQHYFDHSPAIVTSARHVLLDSSAKSVTDHQNLWTRWHDYTGAMARAEFQMPEPEYPTILSQNLWENFDFTSYEKDLFPAAKALGYGQVFIDPVWENDMTKRRSGALVNPGKRQGNMCCPWELEVAMVLGGEAGLKKTVDLFHSAGIQVSSWIGTHISDLYYDHHAKESYCIVLADGRHQYGSGYDSILGMDLNSAYFDYFIDRLKHVREETGIDGYLYDSFYNFGFMPVSYHDMKPRTQARRCAELMTRLSAMGYAMRIESLGPFGQPSHGVSRHYNDDANEFIRYKGNFGPGYSTIPVADNLSQKSHDAQKHFRLLSGKSQLDLPLFIDSVRLDKLVDPLLSQANFAYGAVQRDMHQRTLLPDGAGARWSNTAGDKTTFWAFAGSSIKVPAGTEARDLISGKVLKARGDLLPLEPYRIYQW